MLPDLYAAIRSTAAASTAYDANDNAGVVTALNTKSIQIQDHTLRNVKWFTSTFNKTNSAIYVNAFKNAADASVQADYYALVNAGIDLADADTRDNIDALAVQFSWTNAFRNNLKEKGRYLIAPAMQRIGRDATVQDIVDVRAWWAGVENVRILRQRLVSVFDVVMAEVQSQTLTTEAACRARFMELLSA